MTDEFCIIDELLRRPFLDRSIVEQKEIVTEGRPCPVIPNLTSDHYDKKGNYVRRFKGSQYSSVPWLAASRVLNKLFCWPCLLFSTENGVWSNTGFANLNTLSTAVSRHEKSINHIKLFIRLNKFEREITDRQLNEQQKIIDKFHNENVNKNRSVLKLLIDVVCFLGKQELPFDEPEDSDNKAHFIELMQLISQYDPLFENNLKTSTAFQGSPPSIQYDLISSISAAIIGKINLELEQAEFVALILDETSEIISKSQLSIALRFVDRNGNLQERFLQFSDSSDRSASAVLEQIKLVKNCGKKLVAQTYDGAALMAGEVSGFNTKIKEIYPNAMFVHCYNHMLNSTLQQSASNIKECTLFFQTLSGMSSFFSLSTKRTHAFRQFIQDNFSSDMPLTWNFGPGLVKTIKENYDFILNFFKYLLKNSSDWDNDTIIMTGGFLFFLERKQTHFLISVFSEIFSFTDVLSNILQRKCLNIEYCAKTAAEVIKKLEEHYGQFKENSENNLLFEDPGINLNSTENESDHKRLFAEILDNILNQLRNRFQTIEKLDFFCLLNNKMYNNYVKKFPENALKSLQKQYGSLFDIVRLKNELSVLYTLKEFKNQSVYELLKCVNKNELQNVMKEVYKLAKLIVTIPTMTVSDDGKCSVSRKIKTYCKSKQGQNRLSSLAVLSINKELLNHFKTQPGFYDEVIQKFVDKTQRLEFVYKNDQTDTKFRQIPKNLPVEAQLDDLSLSHSQASIAEDPFASTSSVDNSPSRAASVDNMSSGPTPLKRKKRGADNTNTNTDTNSNTMENEDLKLLNKALQLLQSSTDESQDPYYTYGTHIANELRRFDAQTLAHVKRAFADILFRAETGQLLEGGYSKTNVTPHQPRNYEDAFSHPNTEDAGIDPPKPIFLPATSLQDTILP